MAGMLAGMGSDGAAVAAPKGSTFAKVYFVGDLLVPDGARRGDVDMTALVELITASVTPGAWRVLDSHGGVLDDRDGSRSITPFARDLTLIVRQTAEAHEQVAERLDQLRRLVSARDANAAAIAGPKVPSGLPTPRPRRRTPRSRGGLRAGRARCRRRSPAGSSSMGRCPAAANSRGHRATRARCPA